MKKIIILITVGVFIFAGCADVNKDQFTEDFSASHGLSTDAIE